MRNGIVTIFSAPHLSSTFQRGGGGGLGAPEKEERKKKKWRGLRKCVMRIWGCFFFGSMGIEGKEG